MTLKQKRLIKAISTSKTLKEAGIKAGYSFSARSIYKEPTKSHIAKLLALDKTAITERFIKLGNKAEQQGDLTNAMRAGEDLSKLGGLFTENRRVDATVRNVKDEEMISKYHNRLFGLLPKDNDIKELDNKL